MSHVNINFRKPELESLANLCGLDIDFSTYDEKSPFFVTELPGDKEASDWISRSVLAKAIYEYWGEGKDLQDLHESIKSQPFHGHYKELYRQDSFKFEFETYRGSTKANRVDQIETFGYLGFQGKIDMKKPDQIYAILEEYKPISENVGSTTPEKMFFGRLVQRSDRHAMEIYDLKKRPYKGTTSFEAELSLVSANIAQVKPGSIMYDPFAGTGSFLSAGGHYGALVIGSDIDGRMIRGKGVSHDISSNFKYYGESVQFLDVLTMDFTHNAMRSSLKFDTILCDPPYGIREAIKVLGSKDPEKYAGKEEVEIHGKKSYLHPDYIPVKRHYSLDSLLDDLLQYASERLTIGGRLAFWMPTANDENFETMIPLHYCLELKYNCVQDFNKWSRRLLVYENKGPDFNGQDNTGTKRAVSNFRERYFSNFNK